LFINTVSYNDSWSFCAFTTATVL